MKQRELTPAIPTPKSTNYGLRGFTRISGRFDPFNPLSNLF
jgi:hypothetical protein